jgi:hypothetical protein
MDQESADPAAASDEVIDLIAAIEMHRQETAQESSASAARSEALRRLHELLARERAALQSHGPGARHTPNLAAVTLAIARVGKLADGAAAPMDSGNSSGVHPLSLQAQRNFPRRKGRRTMGRGER